ncbi:MAG: hypothetical protein K1X79_05170 [Oligoflexia bacterium]|nr:hypothetical protein [Oligoflexia bacterium]
MSIENEPFCPKCARSCSLEERRSVIIHLSNWALMVPVAVGVFALASLISLSPAESVLFSILAALGLCFSWRHKYFCSCCEIEFSNPNSASEPHHS